MKTRNIIDNYFLNVLFHYCYYYFNFEHIVHTSILLLNYQICLSLKHILIYLERLKPSILCESEKTHRN